MTEEIQDVVTNAFAALRENNKQPSTEEKGDALQQEEENAEPDADAQEEEVGAEAEADDGADASSDDDPKPKGKRARQEYEARKELERENRALIERLARLEGQMSTLQSNREKTERFLEDRLAPKKPASIEDRLAEYGKDMSDFYGEDDALQFIENKELKKQVEAIQQNQKKQEEWGNHRKQAENVAGEVNGIIKYYREKDAEIAGQIESGVSLFLNSEAQRLLFTNQAQTPEQAMEIAQIQIAAWANDQVRAGKYKQPSHAVLDYAAVLLKQAGGHEGLRGAGKKDKIQKNDFQKTQEMAGKAPVNQAPTKSAGGRKGFSDGYNTWLKESGISQ